MAVHTMTDLYQMQSLPLELKVRMTETRIKAWVNEFGEDGVYISFSGGKDSTVLLDIVRNEMGYKNIPAVFVDVPTQYPELKEFVKTFENVEIIKPKISFVQVCEKYGFPLVSKEVSESVEGARKYLTQIRNEIGCLQTDRQTDRQTDSISIPITTKELQEQENTVNFPIPLLLTKWLSSKEVGGGYDNKYRKLRGIGEYSKRPTDKQKGRKQSTISNNAGVVHEQENDSGKYP